MKFGDKPKAALGYTQQHLAEITGIAPRTIHNYESGERMPKQMDTYRVPAEELHIDETVLRDEDADFVTHVHEIYGAQAAIQARRLVEEVSGLYAGGTLEDEDMDAMMKPIQDAYWLAKKNRKYTP